MDSLKDVAVSKENYTPEARKHRGLFKSILGTINADVNRASNILKKFKKRFHDYIIGLKQTIRLKVFGRLKSSLKSVRVYGQIGVARCGDHLSGIRLSYDSNLP